MDKRKVGLVLGCGGSLGSYEIGAIKALKELGFSFDIITGSSIGVLNGALLASNQFDELTTLWDNLNAGDAYECGMSLSKDQVLHNKYHYSFKDVWKLTCSFWKNKMAFNPRPLMSLFEKTLDVDKLYASNIDLVFPITRYGSMKEIDINVKKDLKKEELFTYLRATSACYPLVKSVKINGKHYIDSFWSNRLPCDLLKKYGANYIIVIDLRFWEKMKVIRPLFNAPNLEYISPYRKLGSIIDYGKDTMSYHKKRGYFDVMKHFQKLQGFIYTFDGEFPISNTKELLQKSFKHFKRMEVIFKQGMRNKKLTDEDYFYRMVEITFEELGINDDTKIYKFADVKSLILEKVQPCLTKKNKIIKVKLFVHRRPHTYPVLRQKLALYYIAQLRTKS